MAVLADHRPAGPMPGLHAAVEVHDLVPLAVEKDRSLRRPAADPTHADDLLVGRELVDAGHQLTQRNVTSVIDVPGPPLVMFSYVEIDGIGRRRARRNRGNARIEDHALLRSPLRVEVHSGDTEPKPVVPFPLARRS